MNDYGPYRRQKQRPNRQEGSEESRDLLGRVRGDGPDTWYTHKLLEDVPSTEVWAAVHDDELSGDDDMEDGEEEGEEATDDDEIIPSVDGDMKQARPSEIQTVAPVTEKKTRKYHGPPKGSDAAKARMEKLRAALWAKHGLKI